MSKLEKSVFICGGGGKVLRISRIGKGDSIRGVCYCSPTI